MEPLPSQNWHGATAHATFHEGCFLAMPNQQSYFCFVSVPRDRKPIARNEARPFLGWYLGLIFSPACSADVLAMQACYRQTERSRMHRVYIYIYYMGFEQTARPFQV